MFTVPTVYRIVITGGIVGLLWPLSILEFPIRWLLTMFVIGLCMCWVSDEVR